MTKWMIFLLTLWLVCAVLGLIIEDAYVGGGEGSTLNDLLVVTGLTTEAGEAGSFKISCIIPGSGLYEALWSVLTFDFMMFTGAWRIFQYLFLIIGVGIGINIMFTAAAHIPFIGRGSGGT